MPVFASLAKRKARVDLIMKRFQRVIGEPEMDLIYNTPFQLLVSVVLSAKVTDAQVNKVMAPQYDAGFSPETVLELSPDGFLARIRSIGLAPTKAQRVYKLSQILMEKFGGDVPSEREDLESLPGVGRKTANVILGALYGHPILAVDTHVYRVTRRLGLHKEMTAEKAEMALLQVIDKKYLHGQHRYFIIHGRSICKALRPLCKECYLADICPSYKLLKSED